MAFLLELEQRGALGLGAPSLPAARGEDAHRLKVLHQLNGSLD